MAKNWAIVVGINNYDNLQALKYAKRDAEAMAAWFREEAKFDEVLLFTEDSPPINTNPPIPTQPTHGRFHGFLNRQFQTSLLKPEDNLWFFFAGHGKRYADQDYLMFLDSDPTSVDKTAISVDYVTQRLRRCGADNVVLLLDACRDEGSRGGLGIGTEEHQGVITFYSCTANQQSWEIDELQHGSFTYTLLEGLRLQGESNCATVERLDQHLRYHVPQLNTRYQKPKQNPYLKAEPPYKMYFILFKQAARLQDVMSLKYQASKAENKRDFSLAEQLWVRVLAVGYDLEAIEAIKRIARTSQNRRGKPKSRKTDDLKSERSVDSTPGSVIGIQRTELTKELFETIFSSLKKHYGEQKWWIRDHKFQICIEAILSQGTEWNNVGLAINNLKAESALTPNAIYEMPEEQLRALIRPCRHANAKASYIKNFVDYLKQHYELNVEQMLAEETNLLRKSLLSITGIGPFTCDNILLYAADQSKIPINDRMRKVFFEHDLINKADSYDFVQSRVESIASLTLDEIREFDAMIFHVARDYCHSTPKCKECPLQQFLNEQGPRSQRIRDDLDDDLSSEHGVDYTQLRDLLKAGQWQNADKETLAVMLKASGKEKQHWLDVESINNIPCTDLRTIDQLWLKYSNGHFGFSVQKRIWESVGGKLNADLTTWIVWGKRVGWYVENNWLAYHSLQFNQNAPIGELPKLPVRYYPRNTQQNIQFRGAIFSRISTCEV